LFAEELNFNEQSKRFRVKEIRDELQVHPLFLLLEICSKSAFRHSKSAIAVILSARAFPRYFEKRLF
jgi:hypothetical protein